MEQPKQNIKQPKLVTKFKRQKDMQPINRSQKLYDYVIERNFEIIDGLLEKLDKVLIRHEELQIEISNCNKRLLKVETDIEAIHNEHRRDAFQIFGKITNMQTELSGIDNHIQIFYDNYKKIQIKPFNSCQVFKNTEDHSQNFIQNIDPVPGKKDEMGIITTKSAKSYDQKMKDDQKYFGHENQGSENKSRDKKQKISNQKMRVKKENGVKRRLSQNYKYTEVTPFQKIKMFPEKEVNLSRKFSRSKKKEYKHRQSLNYNIESTNSGRYYYQDSVITKQRRQRNEKYPSSNFMNDLSNSNQSQAQRQQSVERNKVRKELFQIKESPNEKKSISYSQNQKIRQEQKKQASVKENKPNQLDKSTKFILACIEHAFVSNVKQNKDTLSDYEIATLVHRFEEGTKYIVERLDENAKKIKDLSDKLNQDYFQQKFCSNQFFMKTVKQIYNEIRQLKQSIFQEFVTKEELKYMLLYSSDKNQIQSLLASEDQKKNMYPDSPEVCSIVSKCLSCNRLGKLNPMSSLLSGQESKNPQKKRVFTITQLKKKTAKIIRS